MHSGLCAPPGGYVLIPVGLTAYRREWLTKIPDAVGKRWLWVALLEFLLFVLMGRVGSVGSIDSFWGAQLASPGLRVLGSHHVCGVLCTGLLVFFRKHFIRQRRVWNFLSANAYATYIFHPVILVSLAYGLHFKRIF